ncbi:methylenetetrahydrofolate reductase (NADPH) [Actinomadura meyerae]|uniref:Methylenetetrahydrofolate reductase n=1 Tax=Actinomadura meyerae TaxID=240840 RepID=A0A239NF20_9ACTN|nr:methylenetetrahydrofolate reductase [Actinomadura meyerae]SNT53567.1 methylenetetrahydrofolate reductase (NADPH) [Actinomadura meyerae]
MTDPVEAARELIRGAAIEVIPIKGAERAVAAIPPATKVTITCSPKFGLDRTLEHVAKAARAGHRVVPHLAARQVTGRRGLGEIAERLADLGVTDLFVVGGDAKVPEGPFESATQLLSALAGLDHPFTSIGVTCYPEGHRQIPDEALMESLLAKQELADYMVSQLCFDPGALVGWLRSVRAAGVALPLNLGLAAPLNSRKLLELSLRIGVGSSVRFLGKQHGLVNSLVLGRDYEPEKLVAEIARQESFEDLGIAGLHLFSFNQVERTLQWQRGQTSALPA